MTVKKYPSGLTLIVETTDGLRSVAAGIMVGTGSAYETPETNGISHFIEHLQYKGTRKRSAAQIVCEFDRMGALYNAFTAKEYTCFYFKSIDEKAEGCFDVLCDLFLHSTYAKAELDRERKVIIEEINMGMDEPDGVCYDLLYKTGFGAGSLGMEIIGPKANVERFTKADIVEYKRLNYTAANTVVAFVGNIDISCAERLVESYMAELVCAPACDRPTLDVQDFCGGYGEYIHDYEQSEISVAFPTVPVTSDERIAVSALDGILGSGMSSRLFQRLREKMGLVYNVNTSPWYGKRNGVFSVCANVNVKNAVRAVAAIREEIDLLVDRGVTDEETEKVKMQLKVAGVFGKENPMSYLLAMLRMRTVTDTDYDLDRIIELTDALTADGITAVARRMFARPATIAYVGKKPRKALDAVYNG